MADSPSTTEGLPAGLFPLPLAPFEKYMLLDDRPRHPMAFVIRLLFSGRFDEPAFREAVHRALARHPLLQSHIEGENFRRWKWVPAEQPQVPIDVAPAGTPLRFPDGRAKIDLTSEIGLRIWVRTGEGDADIRFQFHHACCDGIGAYHYIEDVLAAYDQLLHEQKSHDQQPDEQEQHDQQHESQAGQWRPIRPELLRGRTHFGRGWFRRLLHIPAEIWGVIVGMIIFLTVKPVDMPAPEQPQLSEDDEQTVLDMPAHTFSRKQYDAIRATARDAGATVNDVLIRDQLLGMHEWLKQYAPELYKRYLRVMVPVNLRGPADAALPATNVVGMVFIDRKLHLFKKPRSLLLTIKIETLWLKIMRLATAWSRCCYLMLHWVPRGADVLIGLQRPLATSGLSNMGRVFYGHKLRTEAGKIVAGELVLERIESAPPVRPFTSTTITALSYNGELTLIMNYDRYHFTPEAAEGLLQSIVRRMQQTIAEIETSADAGRGGSGSSREAA